MKKTTLIVAKSLTVLSLILMLIGKYLQSLKGKIDIEEITPERFDRIMNGYYLGNHMLQIGVILAAVSAAGWIAVTMFFGCRKKS